MPKKGKRVPEITDNLDKFVEKLLNRVADESIAGRKALVEIMKNARDSYNKPMESWFTGWFYTYTRTRGPAIEQAIKSVDTLPDAYTRLQEIKMLVEKGEWEPDSSYNYYLFVELVKSVPGYASLEEKFKHLVVLKVKDKILDKIDEFIYQYDANQKLNAEKDKELEATRERLNKSVDHIQLHNNLESARDSAKKHPKQIHFCLNVKEELCSLWWLDVAGEEYALAPSEELATLITNQKIEDVEKLNKVHRKQVITECIKTRNKFLQHIQLYINPKNPDNLEEINNESLVDMLRLVSTFILRSNARGYSLYWVTTVGKINEISLEAYPEFKKWLDGHSSFDEEQLAQLKAFLLNVDTVRAISGMDEFKKELQDLLSKGPRSVVHTSQKLESNRLDMSLYDNIKKCLEGHKASTATEVEHIAVEPISTEELSTSSESISSANIPTAPKLPKSRLNMGNYAAIAQLFGPKDEQVVESDGVIELDAGEEEPSTTSELINPELIPVPPKPPVPLRFDNYAGTSQFFGHKKTGELKLDEKNLDSNFSVS